MPPEPQDPLSTHARALSALIPTTLPELPKATPRTEADRASEPARAATEFERQLESKVNRTANVMVQGPMPETDVRSRGRTENFKKQFPDEKEYRHSLAEEITAMRAALLVLEQSPRSERSSP